MGILGCGKKKDFSPTSGQSIKVIGVYSLPESPDVKLIEIFIACPAPEFDVGSLVQPENGAPKDSWQAAYDEWYLNEDGTEVIGEGMISVPKDISYTRLAFFMYFVKFEIPLLSQFGEIKLPAETPMPDRLKNIIKFAPAD